MEPASFIVLTQGNWEGLQNVPRKIRVIQNTLPVKNQNVVKWCSIQIFWSFTLASKNSRIFEIPLESALNLHGNSIEPPWNLHRSYNRTTKYGHGLQNVPGQIGVIYIKTPWNLHGTSMEPALLIQQDHTGGSGKTFKTYLENRCNLHQTSMETPWNPHQTCIINTTEPLQGKWQDLQNIAGKSM